MRWYSGRVPEGMRVKKLSARVSGRLPTTLSRASARPSSLLIQLEKPAGPPPVPPSPALPFPACNPKSF